MLVNEGRTEEGPDSIASHPIDEVTRIPRNPPTGGDVQGTSSAVGTSTALATYSASSGRLAYGVPIGILCLDCAIPFIPGDVGNATSYDFPVMYELVPGATVDAIVFGHGTQMLKPVIEAAQRLERQGVRAITSDCGYFGAFQAAVAKEVSVPVFLSSLLQIPLIQQIVGTTKKFGIVVANQHRLNAEFLSSMGLPFSNQMVVLGLQDYEHFRAVIIEEREPLCPERLQVEVVEACRSAIALDPSIGAFLFECSDLPPYSAAVQVATGIPVFDWIGFIRYIHHAVTPHRYNGIF
jgi:hypothetical protein